MKNLFNSKLATSFSSNLQSVADLAKQSYSTRMGVLHEQGMSLDGPPPDVPDISDVSEANQQQFRKLLGHIEALRKRDEMLRQEILRTKNSVGENVQLQSQLEDMKVKLVFALKGASSDAIVPTVVQELQLQNSRLSEELAAAELEAGNLRVETVDLRFKLSSIHAAEGPPPPTSADRSDASLLELQNEVAQLRAQLRSAAEAAELAASRHADRVAELESKLTSAHSAACDVVESALHGVNVADLATVVPGTQMEELATLLPGVQVVELENVAKGVREVTGVAQEAADGEPDSDVAHQPTVQGDCGVEEDLCDLFVPSLDKWINGDGPNKGMSGDTSGSLTVEQAESGTEGVNLSASNAAPLLGQTQGADGSRLRQHIASLEASVQQLRKRVASLEGECTDSEALVQDYRQHVACLEGRCREQAALVEGLHQQISSLEGPASDAASAVELQAELDVLVCQAGRTTQLLAPSVNTLSDSRKVLAELALAVAELDGLFDIVEAKHVQPGARVEARGMHVDAELATELSRLHVSNGQLKEYNKSLREEMKKKAEQVTDLEAQVKTLSGSLEKLGGNYARQFERHESDHEVTLQGLHLKYKAEVAACTDALTAANASLTEVKRREEALLNELTVMKNHIPKVEQEAKKQLDTMALKLKAKAAEVEDLYAHAAISQQRVQAAESAAEKARKKSEKAESKSQALSAAHAELAIFKKTTEAAEAKIKNLEAAAAAANLDVELVRAEAAELVEKNKELSEQISRLTVLVGERDELERQLMSTRVALSEMSVLQHRLESAESDRDRHQADAARTATVLSNLELRIAQLEDDNERLLNGLDEESRRSAAELDLTRHKREKWPPAVRKLVEQIEARSAAESNELNRASDQAARAAVAEEVDELQSRCQSLEQDLAAARLATQRSREEAEEADRLASVTERHLRDELAAAETARAAAVEKLSRELDAMQEASAAEITNAKKEAEQWRSHASKLTDDMQALRERTRSLMEEKDAELERVKGALRCVGVGASSTALASMVTTSAGDAPIPFMPRLQSSAGDADQEVASTSKQDGGTTSSETASVEYWKGQADSFQQAYEDSENTHVLRNQTEAALKDEIAKLQALTQLVDGDISYLRSVIISGFETGSLPKNSPIFPVLARLLRFTPVEVEHVQAAKAGGIGHSPSSSSVINAASAWSYLMSSGASSGRKGAPS